jgi:hypothetical protein
MKGEKNYSEKVAKIVKYKIIISVVFVLLIGGISVSAFYYSQIAPLNRRVLAVDEKLIDMRYFLKRVRLAEGNTLATLQLLSRELIISITAPGEPYNIHVSEHEIDVFLKNIATDANGNLNEDEFKEWYRQQINDSLLSESEFRNMAYVMLLTRVLQTKLMEDVDTNPLQVHLKIIFLKNNEDALLAKERLDDGENFDIVARDMSINAGTKYTGGDMGWFPREALNPQLADLAFDVLKIREYSAPLFFDEQTFAIVMVAAKENAAADEDTLESIGEKVLNTWLENEITRHKIEFFGFSKGYDSKTDEWVKRWIQKNPLK